MTLPPLALRWLLLIPLVLVAWAPLPASAQARFDLRGTPTRLGTDVMPLSVKLALDVDPARDDFTGEVTVQLQVSKTVPALVLHAVGLQAHEASLGQGATQRALRVLPDAEGGLWRLRPVDGRPVPAGRQTLHIRYTGRVLTRGEGLYRAEYRVDGVVQRMLATQLQAVQARRVLPAFDEPMFRSVFELTVRAPAGLQVLTNMPRHSARDEGATVRHRFQPTPPMPAYLLALAVGRFDVLADEVDGVPLRIFTVPGKRELAREAMAATRQLLPFYRAYFGRPYALPKLDQLAVPGTRQGAMEDWGLISYVENALLVDPARSGARTRQRVFGTVAHELAHQWFGNLVSVSSWNEIWLNEAFATWMERKATAHFHPEWMSDLQQRRRQERTLSRDAGTATRAIRSGPVSEASVDEVFDGITYGKGGSVLSMVEQWLGAPTFQRGLAAYMAERAMKPASAGDLWFHIGRAAGKPVAAMASRWTDQPGLPLVQVAARCEAGRTVLELRQSRWSLGEDLPAATWPVPVRLAQGGVERTLMLDRPLQRFDWPGCSDAPLVANAGGQGYYRVAYDEALRVRLVAAFDRLPGVDRVALLSDSFALAAGGRQPMAAHLDLLAALPRVHDASRASLFAIALDQWDTLDHALHATPAQAPLRRAARALFGPELARLGWQVEPGEDVETQVLRADLVPTLVRYGDGEVLTLARERFADALAGGGRVPASLRGAVLAAVGSEARIQEFEALLAALRSATAEEERRLLLRALGAVGDPALAQRLLDEALADRLPAHVRVAIPGELADRPEHAAMAYDFVTHHWAVLASITSGGPFGQAHWLLPGAAGASIDPTMASRLLEDQRRQAGVAGNAPAAIVAAALRQRQRLREREADRLAAALAARP